jgi:hypothetical protein
MLRGINAIESVVSAAIGLPCGMAAVAKDGGMKLAGNRAFRRSVD